MNLLEREFCIDSRRVKPGCVFVAIKGERHDGHDFVREALEKGAEIAVVERPLGTGKEIVVDNVVNFLMELASEKMKAEIVIGVTGSSGKTFTKEVLHRLLPGSFRTHGNLNTEIGLPLSILNGYSGEKIAILEMGVDKPGDIRSLCRIVKPNVGVVLNVGRQHAGNFSSLEELFRAKMEMFECSETTVYNADDGRMVDWISRSGKKGKGFGKERGDCRLVDWRYSRKGTEAVYDVFGRALYVSFKSALHEGHLLDIAASICVLSSIGKGLDPEALSSVEPLNGRFKTIDIDGVRLIDDTYNASLGAFEVAIEAMMRMDGRRMAVVGPILEQGGLSRETHERLSDILESLDGVFVLDGFEGSEYINPSNAVFRSESKDELARAVIEEVRKGDIWLFKASRKVKMEEVFERVVDWLSR